MTRIVRVLSSPRSVDIFKRALIPDRTRTGVSAERYGLQLAYFVDHSAIRLAIAIPPSTIIRMIAIGVSQARMFDWSAVAPVRNGEVAYCSSATSGSNSRDAGTTTSMASANH
jgi:hypothetical protein